MKSMRAIRLYISFFVLTAIFPSPVLAVQAKQTYTQPAKKIHQIHNAAFEGRVNVLRYLIEKKNISPNLKDEDSVTPLHYAAASGKLEAIKYLMQKKADTQARTADGLIPMHFAALFGQTQIVKFFIEKAYINTNITDSRNRTVLHYAALRGHLDIVKYMVQQKAAVNARDIEGGEPIHFAAENGHTHILKYFIEGGYADKNARRNDDATPLHFAAMNGHITTVQYLISKKVTVESRTKIGITALSCAWGSGHDDVVHAMIGLKVKRNKHNMLIPESAHAKATKFTDWKKLMCASYVGPLPSELNILAHNIATHIGMKDIFFYHTTNEQSHATGLGFSKIGLSTKAIQSGVEYLENKSYGKSFLRVLYHELCHIKADDTTKYYIEKIAPTDIAALTREMAAELGAMYYLYTLDKTAAFIFQISDDEHPTQDEHWRYIAYLYAQLLANPKLDFTIVEKLAALYYQEKLSGIQQIPNMTLEVAGKLLKKNMLSTTEYAIIRKTADC